MKRNGILIVLLLLCILVMAGCGNVYLKGEALTAAETSAMDAYQATKRADADPNTPTWEKAYLSENFRQWRFYVRSAKKDLAWGPKLEGER